MHCGFDFVTLTLVDFGLPTHTCIDFVRLRCNLLHFDFNQHSDATAKSNNNFEFQHPDFGFDFDTPTCFAGLFESV